MATDRSPSWVPPPPPGMPSQSTTKRRQRSRSPMSYDPACIRKVSWPRGAVKPTEVCLRATFSRLAPVATVGIGNANAAIVVFASKDGAIEAQKSYAGLWRVSLPKVSAHEARRTLATMAPPPPRTPSPSRSRSPRRRRSFDLSTLINEPAESRRDLAKRILVVSWDLSRAPPEESELRCFFGFFDFVLATHVTPRRGLVLVASRAQADKCVAACRKHQYQRFRVRVLGRTTLGTPPAVRHIRAATRESVRVRFDWEANETPSPASKVFAVPRSPSVKSTPDRYGEGERPYVVGGMLVDDDEAVSSGSSVDEEPVPRRVAFGVVREVAVARAAPAASVKAHHHHHSAAAHPPSLIREAAVANHAPLVDAAPAKHHHARKDAMTSPPPKKAADAMTSPPPVPQWMRRPAGPSPAERNYAAVAESLARDAFEARREAARMRARALRAEDLLALAVRRPPTSAWREAAPPVRPRAPSVRRRVAARPCGTSADDMYDYAPAPAARYTRLTLSQQRRRFGVDDYRAFRDAVCSRPPNNWYDSKPAVGAYNSRY